LGVNLLTAELYVKAVASERAGPARLRKLLEAVVSVGSELDLSSVLRRIVELGVELTGARYGALGVLDEPRTGLAEFITVGLDDHARRRIGAPKGLGLLGALISDARPLRLPNLAEHPGRSGFPPEHPPVTSFLGVPIRVRDEVFGNLYLTDKRDSEVFTDTDEELVLGLASAAGVAIANARLFDQLRRREGALAAIQGVASSLLGGAAPADSLRFVAARARVLAGAELATFALPAADSETLVMEVSDGRCADLTGTRFERAGSVSGDVLRSGETAVIDDLSRDQRRAQPQVRSGAIGPAIFVALTAGGEPFHTLFVGRAVGAQPFSTPDVEIVRSFAAQASVVLDSARQR
jgi:GAF domain-containing protein